MSSKIDRANQALSLLGSKPIISFNDDSHEAGALNTIYEPTKAFVLRQHEWGCATRTETLAELADPPVDTYWPFAYAIPEDVIRIINVFSNGIEYYNRREWQIEETKILSRIPNAIARYTFNVSEPRLDAHVEALLVARLALDLAYPLTASNTRESNLATLYKEKLTEARTTDNLEGSHTGFRIDGLQQVRY